MGVAGAAGLPLRTFPSRLSCDRDAPHLHPPGAGTENRMEFVFMELFQNYTQVRTVSSRSLEEFTMNRCQSQPIAWKVIFEIFKDVCVCYFSVKSMRYGYQTYIHF